MLKLRPVLKKDLQDPLHPTHRSVHTQSGYYEQMKRYSDLQTEQFTQTLTDAGVTVKLATLEDDYIKDIDLYINSTLPISLKTPLTIRDSQPIELLREDKTNKWRASWGMTTQAKYFIWYSPDCSILVVNVKELQQYILANVQPLTNNSLTTRKKLEDQGRSANVVNRWVTQEELLALPSSVLITPNLKPATVRGYFRSLAGTS